MTMKQNDSYFEIVPDEKMHQYAQENESKLFKLKSVQLPDASFKDAERAINLDHVKVTNKMWTRLQTQLKKEKEKERQRQLLSQQQHEQDINDDGFEP